MKIIEIRPDRSLAVAERPDPVCGADEVVVDIYAAGVNRADLMQRAGNYPPPPGAPDWMGLEIAGRIAKIGKEVPKEAGLAVGDRVCALLGGGGYAEKVNVRYDMVVKLPENVDMAHGAVIPEAFATAYLNLMVEAHAAPGETLFMPAGASGLASVVIPMAKAFGLRVITTVRDEDCDNGALSPAVAKLGADLVINTSHEDTAAVLKAECDAGRPVDIAIDCVGGKALGTFLPYLSYAARYIVIAALAGEETCVNLRTIYVKNIRIIGSTLRSRQNAVKAKILAELGEKVMPLVADGTLEQSICAVFPFADAEKAHKLMDAKHAGKIVLIVREEA